jgi:spermidine synthase
VLVAGVFLAEPIIKFGEQKKYLDKVVYAKQTKYQRIVMTQWKDEYWLYLNGNLQLSTIDEVMYHEPLVHPAMTLHPNPQKVLVLGGGDGCAVREILKYKSVDKVSLVDLDPEMTRLGLEHPVWTNQNENALQNPKVEIINQDGFSFLADQKEFYDVIIVDLPDPKTVELNRLYSQEFYQIAHKHLRPNGVLITQAGSPYFATRAFNCIFETMKAADFNAVAMHNQILSLGEWGWVLGVKSDIDFDLKKKLQTLEFNDIETEWINREAMQLMTSFGKNIFPIETDSVEINRIHDPVLYKYYLEGNWDLY